MPPIDQFSSPSRDVDDICSMLGDIRSAIESDEAAVGALNEIRSAIEEWSEASDRRFDDLQTSLYEARLAIERSAWTGGNEDLMFVTAFFNTVLLAIICIAVVTATGLFGAKFVFGWL